MEEINDNDLKQKIEERKKELELEKAKAYASAVGTQQTKEISIIAQDVNKTAVKASKIPAIFLNKSPPFQVSVHIVNQIEKKVKFF